MSCWKRQNLPTLIGWLHVLSGPITLCVLPVRVKYFSGAHNGVEPQADLVFANVIYKHLICLIFIAFFCTFKMSYLFVEHKGHLVKTANRNLSG